MSDVKVVTKPAEPSADDSRAIGKAFLEHVKDAKLHAGSGEQQAETERRFAALEQRVAALEAKGGATDNPSTTGDTN